MGKAPILGLIGRAAKLLKLFSLKNFPDPD